ncbi:uncharacterized protein LOC115091191 isoform X2 [Rhinatrema bivittatum]|nr:uncharacterized protein LOC115091191 isoform X2 [Rhinatrema bivittatum]
MHQTEQKVQTIMDGATKKNHTVEDFKEEGSSVHTDPEEEDYLCWLTEEEKECLQFLLETINSLDVEESQEYGADSSSHTSEKAQNLQDGTEECDSLVNFNRKPKLEMSQRTSTETKRAADKSECQSAASAMKMIKSFSEEFPGVSFTGNPESLRKLAGSHPSHLRKFDTIMRSGVNVQELRARFVAQRGVSDLGVSPKATEVSGATKQPIQTSGIVRSPREEALHKLGLLQTNQSLPSMTCPSETFVAGALSAGQNCDITQGVSKISEEPSVAIASSSISQSSGGNNHQEALRKLGLLKF